MVETVFKSVIFSTINSLCLNKIHLSFDKYISFIKSIRCHMVNDFPIAFAIEYHLRYRMPAAFYLPFSKYKKASMKPS